MLLKFLEKANKGISLNLCSYHLPTIVCRSDSCPHGLGGYNHLGFEWRFYLPDKLLYQASNNLLEHMASIITVWIDILAGRTKPEDCILSMTDSSTSAGWAYKSNFDVDPLQEADCYVDPTKAQVQEEVCQYFAPLLLENDLCQYSQWFPGKENDVSDALSRDDDRSDKELTHILHTFVPEQILDYFEIVPLPNVIVSWLTALGKTLEDQDRAWRRWEQYANSIGLRDDLFLDGFSRPNRIKLMGAFAVAMREGRFSERYAEGTIRGAVSYVASTFRDSDQPNPTKDDDGELGRLLSRLY
jgi:hypothetical protein